MKFSVLASGSSGNCIYIESGETRILVDAGISRKVIKDKLDEIGVDLNNIQGLCITHDHIDHTKGIQVISKNHGIPLYGTWDTSASVNLRVKKELYWNVFEAGTTFQIGGVRIEAFRTPHDANGSVGYVFNDGTHRLGIATDMGELDEVAIHHLKKCDALILEFNHEPKMVNDSARPWNLKQRILGRHGHLSNEQASQLLARVACERLRTLYLAHISSECNTRELAQRYAETTLNVCGLSGRVDVTHAMSPRVFDCSC